MDSTTALIAALRCEEDEPEQLMEFEEDFDNFDFEKNFFEPRRILSRRVATVARLLLEHGADVNVADSR
jgi:hypothetical protein